MPFSNRLLASLTPSDLARLRPQLHPIELKHVVLIEVGATVHVGHGRADFHE